MNNETFLISDRIREYSNLGFYDWRTHFATSIEYLQGTITQKGKKYFELENTCGKKSRLFITESTKDFKIGDSVNIPTIPYEYNCDKLNHTIIWDYVILSGYYLDEILERLKEIRSWGK